MSEDGPAARRAIVIALTVGLAVAVAGAAYSSWQSQRRAEDWTALHGLEYMVDYVCERDCSAFKAGALRAAEQELENGDHCPRRAQVAFYQGCLATVAYRAYLEDVQLSAGAAGEEVDLSQEAAPSEPEYMRRAKERQKRKWDQRIRRWL